MDKSYCNMDIDSAERVCKCVYCIFFFLLYIFLFIVYFYVTKY